MNNLNFELNFAINSLSQDLLISERKRQVSW